MQQIVLEHLDLPIANKTINRYDSRAAKADFEKATNINYYVSIHNI